MAPTTAFRYDPSTAEFQDDIWDVYRVLRDEHPVFYRIESPTQVLPRTAVKDTEIHGVTIPAESRVMLVWGAANHDDREFPDPERVDVRRGAIRHLAFGHGAHFCLGANLARLEARVAFEEWHARFPNYELSAEPTRAISIWARAYSRVPISIR